MRLKIEKADKGARAAESYWALFFAEGSLGRWIIPVISGGLTAVAARFSEWVNPYGPIGWVAAALAGFMIAAIALAAIEHGRTMRSLRKSAEQSPDSTAPAPSNLQELEEVRDRYLEDLEEHQRYLGKIVDTANKTYDRVGILEQQSQRPEPRLEGLLDTATRDEKEEEERNKAKVMELIEKNRRPRPGTKDKQPSTPLQYYVGNLAKNRSCCRQARRLA